MAARTADAAPSAYARRVAVNLALDEYRARRREAVAVEREAIALCRTDAQENGRVEQRADTSRALSTLSARARAVIVLRYYGDLTERQVADALGCSVGTVKTTASRALAKLREQRAATYAAR